MIEQHLLKCTGQNHAKWASKVGGGRIEEIKVEATNGELRGVCVKWLDDEETKTPFLLWKAFVMHFQIWFECYNEQPHLCGSDLDSLNTGTLPPTIAYLVKAV